MDAALRDLGELIAASLGEAVTSTEVSTGELVIHAEANQIVKVLTYLRDDANCRFKLLVDVCGVDYPENEQRFEIVYNLLSLTHNSRVRVKIATDEETPVPSVIGVFSSANWFEREIWDLLGVYFTDHPDLRRLPRSVAEPKAHVRAHLGHRLDARRAERGRGRRGRGCVPRARREPHRRVRGSDPPGRRTDLRAHVPDAV